MQSQPLARPRQVDRRNPDEQRNRGYRLKVNKALQANPANLLQIAMTRDPGYERAENQRRHDHLDQAQKNIAEKAQVHRELRAIQPDLKPREHGEEYPKCERTPAHSRKRQTKQTNPAEDDVHGLPRQNQEQQRPRREEQQACRQKQGIRFGFCVYQETSPVQIQ